MKHNWEMRNRRFLLLAAILVALNVSLWLVPQGLALQRVVVSSLFGKNMVRADVTETRAESTWHVDRGVVVSNAAGVLTLHEADATIAADRRLLASTKVTAAGGTAFKLKSDQARLARPRDVARAERPGRFRGGREEHA